MNTQLVDSIVQLVETLPPAERDLVKHKLLYIVSPQPLVERQTSSGELTLAERRAFLRQPLAERRAILAQQAAEMLTHYQSSTEWRELMAGDIIDD
jgi:hypothetical protein